jgi:hypothetical protein
VGGKGESKYMPFKSKKQRRYMYAKHPKIAKKWEKETDDTDLPEKAKKKKPIEEFGISKKGDINKLLKKFGIPVSMASKVFSLVAFLYKHPTFLNLALKHVGEGYKMKKSELRRMIREELVRQLINESKMVTYTIPEVAKRRVLKVLEKYDEEFDYDIGVGKGGNFTLEMEEDIAKRVAPILIKNRVRLSRTY